MKLKSSSNSPPIPAPDEEEAQEWKKEWQKEKAHLEDLLATIRKNNWMLLHEMYPKDIRSSDVTFNSIVYESDQSRRLSIAGLSCLLFVVTGLFFNLNTTSLHGVYRDQLADIWLPEPDMKLKDLNTASKGAPIQLFNCTVNRMGSRDDPDWKRNRDLLCHACSAVPTN